MGVSLTQGQPQEVDHRGSQHSGEHYFFFFILAPHIKFSGSILEKNENQPTHSYMSIHIWMEITGNGCILKQDGVMLTSPASCGLVSLEGTETTQGFLGFHFGGFFGAWLTRESLVKLRAGREAE